MPLYNPTHLSSLGRSLGSGNDPTLFISPGMYGSLVFTVYQMGQIFNNVYQLGHCGQDVGLKNLMFKLTLDKWRLSLRHIEKRGLVTLMGGCQKEGKETDRLGKREGKQRSNPLMDLSQKHTCSNRHRQKYVQRKIVGFSNWHVFGCQGLGTQTTHKGYLEFKLILICKSRNSLTNVNLPLTFSLQDWCKKKWKTGAKIENTSIRT